VANKSRKKSSRRLPLGAILMLAAIVAVLAIALADWLSEPDKSAASGSAQTGGLPPGAQIIPSAKPNVVYPADTVLPGIGVGLDSLLAVLTAGNLVHNVSSGDPVMGLPNTIVTFPSGLVQVVGDRANPFEVTVAGESKLPGGDFAANHPLFVLAHAINPACLELLWGQGDSIWSAGTRADSVVYVASGLRMVGRHTSLGGGSMLILTVTSE
jgi:hypothetical protein